MLILWFVNVGNSRISARDSMVVLTHMRGLLLLHLHEWFPTTYKSRRGIVGSRFLFIINLSIEPVGKTTNNLLTYNFISNFLSAHAAFTLYLYLNYVQ